MRDKKRYEQPYAAPFSKRPKKLTKGVVRQLKRMIRTHELEKDGIASLVMSYGISPSEWEGRRR